MVEPAPRRTEDALLVEFARALHVHGASAPRLEHTMQLLARRFALTAQFFSTPTAVFAAFGDGPAQRTYLVRVEPADVDLEKLSLLHELIARTRSGAVEPEEARRRLAAIMAAPPRWGALLRLVAFAGASGSSTRFLGGGPREIAVAVALGVVTGLLAFAGDRVASIRRTFTPLASMVVAFLGVLAAHACGPLSVSQATLGGLIYLLPGLTLTVAMNELATRHLASGTARLAGALVDFLSIGFGVALGAVLGGAMFGAPAAPPAAAPLPPWTALVALAAALPSFAVLLRARPRDLGWIALGGAIAYTGAAVGARLLGPQIGAFLGTLLLGISSNWFARTFDRPSTVPYVPGLLMLVPGSIGFHGLAALLAHDVVPGVAAAFSMIMVAVALVAGMLVAGEIVPSRRPL